VSSRRNGRFNVHQLQIEWNGAKALLPSDSAVERPVLRLRWDFKNNFPQPLPEAVDAGQLTAEDTLPHSVQAIHQEHGRRMLGALCDLDAAADRCRNNPAVPAAASDELSEPTRLKRWYASLLGLYEEWFGKEAAEAFDRAVRAWHAHVEVVVDRKPPVAKISPPSQPMAENSPVIDAEIVEPPVVATVVPAPRLPGPIASRVIARLPVPRPLPIAIEEQHFGVDDDGKPIRPSADEIREITEAHAEKLVELLETSRPAQLPVKNDLLDQYHTGITAYERSFGERAARQLEAYVQRQAGEPANSRRRHGTSSHEAGR
jgi:hypothetical protein